MFDYFVVFAGVKIEASSKRIGSLLVEVILGHLIDGIVDKRKSGFKVSANLIVGFSKCATFVVHEHLVLRFGRIRYTKQVLAQFRATVWHTEYVGKNEVVESTAHEGFTLDGSNFIASALCLKLLNLLENGVTCSNGVIAALPCT